MGIHRCRSIGGNARVIAPVTAPASRSDRTMCGHESEGSDTVRIQDKVAVVTGAGSGIGYAIATRFAAEGAKVVAGDWNATRLAAVVAEIEHLGGTGVGTQGNIA